MSRRSQLCPGSGLDAGVGMLKRLVATCPACGRRVTIRFGNRLEAHGVTRGQGGRKPKRVKGRPL
jgi:hypothetical protein